MAGEGQSELTRRGPFAKRPARSVIGAAHADAKRQQTTFIGKLPRIRPFLLRSAHSAVSNHMSGLGSVTSL